MRIGSALMALAAGTILCGMAPGDMSVAAFLARAGQIERLGPLAIATPEAHYLKGEVIAAGKRYKARIDAERKAGRRTTSCPPESGTLTPEQWLAHLRSYPPQSQIDFDLFGIRRTDAETLSLPRLMRHA